MPNDCNFSDYDSWCYTHQSYDCHAGERPWQKYAERSAKAGNCRVRYYPGFELFVDCLDIDISYLIEGEHEWRAIYIAIDKPVSEMVEPWRYTNEWLVQVCVKQQWAKSALVALLRQVEYPFVDPPPGNRNAVALKRRKERRGIAG